jgi:hypothetical protein
VVANDMALRPALAALRLACEDVVGATVRPSDGYFLINKFCVVCRRAGYPTGLRRAFAQAVNAVARSIEQPDSLRRPGEWGVLPRPVS